MHACVEKPGTLNVSLLCCACAAPHTKKPLKKNEQLKTRVEKDLASIKRSPRLIRSFFRAESVAYIMN
jgi:hypothetical protein